ncbi:MAG: AraC family transcriptional regulator [Actinobacteria bacterium]|nr:AraC family transcriptional regulator [Actinomycetota bacterium]
MATNVSATPGQGYTPVVARSHGLYRAVEASAFDCVRLVFVRAGSAVVVSEFGEKPVSPGDVVVLSANTMCGIEPEGSVTLTTVCLDYDYVIDQVFWQYAASLTDRWQAQDFAEEMYTEPAQLLRLGEQRVGWLSPWLDEIVCLSLDGPSPDRFYRLQSLLFAVFDVLAPYLETSRVRVSASQRRTSWPGPPRQRRFLALRGEARAAAQLMRADPARRWTLVELADSVHLSVSQLGRVFAEAFGKTPLAYLSMLRAEQMARLLRETDLSVEQAARQVGWTSRNHAARLFRQVVGVPPRRYRELARRTAAA